MPLLLKMAWRNILRNVRRSLITLSAITFGLAAMLFFFGLSDGFLDMWVDNAVRAYTGHMQVFREGYRKDPDLSKSIENASAIEKELAKFPAIQAYAPRMELEGLVATAENSFGALVRGVDAEREKDLTYLRDRLIEGGYLEREREILLGYRLVKRLGVSIGDKVVVTVQGADGAFNAELFRLKGVFRMGDVTIDSSFAVVTIEDARRLAGMKASVTEVTVLLKERESVPEAASAVREALEPLGYEVYAWDELMPALMEMIEVNNIFMYVIFSIVLVVVSFGILNTMLMSIMERTREFGIMMAIGASPWSVVALVVTESLILGFIGTAAGAGTGLGLNALIGVTGGVDLSQWSSSLEFFGTVNPVIYPKVVAAHVLLSCLAVLVAAVTAALYPAFRAVRLRPVEAMRRV